MNSSDLESLLHWGPVYHRLLTQFTSPKILVPAFVEIAFVLIISLSILW